MRPIAHVALALGPLLGYAAVRYHRLPSGHSVLLVLFATQLPDIVDKPLAWTLGVLPSGRMFAHSLVVCLPLLAACVLLGSRRGLGRPAVVFSLAYLSHVLGDFYPIAQHGTAYYFFPNLFWPLLPANPDRAPSFAAHAPASAGDVLLPLGVGLLVMSYAVFDIARRS
jgi:membrane-bound metal-dependent hydrolase YbcI (DUF457 family)